MLVASFSRHPGEDRDLPPEEHAADARDPRLRRCDYLGDGERGFTLIELMVVIVIIGLLTTIVAINVLPSGDKARLEKAKADVEILTQAVEMYRLDNLSYPSSADGLNALVSPPATLTNPGRYRQGGYIRRLPEDPWGHPYRYASPGKHGAFDIFSTGADGQEGGEGDNADIGNWH